jgi:enoyl-CoA hydratase/carnithine racemase
MEAMLTEDSMSGTEAVAAGFANAFPAAELNEDVLAIAAGGQVPPDLQALNKRVVHRAMEGMGMRDACGPRPTSARSASTSARAGRTSRSCEPV